MTNFQEVLNILHKHNVEFVLIGGLAAIAHGCTTATSDIDLLYNQSRENIKKLVTALSPYHVRLRGAPSDLPFLFDEKTFANTQNFTFMTDLGAIDLLSLIPGFNSYNEIASNAEKIQLFNVEIKIISLNDLIKNKKATGRPKDLQFLAELEELKKLQEK